MELTNNYEYIDERVINYINGILKTINENDFSEERFRNWLIKNSVGDKNNPSAYVKSCFKKELDNGTFKKVFVEKYPLEKHKLWYLVKPYQTDFYDGLKFGDILIYIIDNEIMKPTDFEALLLKIIDYIKSKEEEITIGKINEMLYVSKALKGKVDWHAIELEYEDSKQLWESIGGEEDDRQTTELDYLP